MVEEAKTGSDSRDKGPGVTTDQSCSVAEVLPEWLAEVLPEVLPTSGSGSTSSLADGRGVSAGCGEAVGSANWPLAAPLAAAPRAGRWTLDQGLQGHPQLHDQRNC